MKKKNIKKKNNMKNVNSEKCKPRKIKYYKQDEYIKKQKRDGIISAIFLVIVILTIIFFMIRKYLNNGMDLKFWIISMVLIILFIIILIISSLKISKKNKTVGDIVLDTLGNEVISSMIDNIT